MRVRAREIDKLHITEYAIQYRHGPVHGRPVEAHHQAWKDGSGFNNPDSVYRHLGAARTQLRKLRTRLERRGYTNIEFKILTREVTRTEWRQYDD